jgi:hypothetical protein
MRVFISWSGGVSKAVALVLRNWLPYVLHEIEPYVSSEDIDKGANWSASLGRELDSSNYGIICVTKENQHAPWLNFEAGALAKSFTQARVTPFLLDLVPVDVKGPLSLFQATTADKDDVERLIRSINGICERSLSDERVSETVNVWWPKLADKLSAIQPASDAPRTSQRDLREMVDELLTITRATQRMIVRREEGFAIANAEITGKSRIVLAELKYMVETALHHAGIASQTKIMGEHLVAYVDSPPTVEVRLQVESIVAQAGLSIKWVPRSLLDQLSSQQDG